MADMPTEHSAFPAWLSFLLNNPIRRWRDPPRKMIEKLGIDRTSTVLDFGCGPGFFTIPMARVAKAVVGVDVQPEMLEKTSRYASREGVKVETVQSDGTEIPLPDAMFDLVFLSHVYHEVREKQRVLAEFQRVLKPGGRLVIVESTKSPFLGLGPPAMDLEEVREQLTIAGFGVSEIADIKGRAMITAKK